MKSIFKLVPIAIIILMCFSFSSNAQDMALNSKERFLQLKKIKLLETLDMDEQTADKFLVKFTALEKDMAKTRDEIDELNSQLNKLIKKDAGESEIGEVVKKIESKMEEMHKARKTFMSEAQKLLTPKQYAKLILFEFRFEKQVHKLLMKKHRGGRGDRFDKPDEDE